MVDTFILMDIRYINHNNLTDQELNFIIELKDKVWTFGSEKQLGWIKKNVLKDDIHALYFKDDTLVSYLLLVPIEIEVNTEKKSGYGVSTVCSLEKGKGYGKSIMDHINDKLRKEDKVGLLFCQSKNVEFYQKCNWKILENTKLEIKDIKIDNVNVFALYFNYPFIIDKLMYNGKVF